jgi:hypothetical protein
MVMIMIAAPRQAKTKIVAMSMAEYMVVVERVC